MKFYAKLKESEVSVVPLVITIGIVEIHSFDNKTVHCATDNISVNSVDNHVYFARKPSNFIEYPFILGFPTTL